VRVRDCAQEIRDRHPFPITRGNGAVTNYHYDAVSRLDQLVQNLNGTANDVTFGYSYNPAGEIVSSTRSNDAYSFTGHANANIVDSVNGLNQVPNSGGASVVHGDGRGNITAIGATGYAYTTEDRLRLAGTGTLTYGPEGDLLCATGAATTRFDSLEGHITPSATRPGRGSGGSCPGPKWTSRWSGTKGATPQRAATSTPTSAAA
jgi:hypothetical protein